MKKLVITLVNASVFAMCFNTVVSAQNQVRRTDENKKKATSNFTGNTSVKIYTNAQNGLNCSVGSVSFEPGARSNWHAHRGGQILIITEGTAFYQEKGKAKRILHQGDVVTCLPNVEHWHGASPDSRMVHTAIGPNADEGAVVWLGKVGDEVYLSGETIAATKEFLDKRQQSIAAIAALTAKGNLPILKTALDKGLEAGLTINEIKEILIQLYAYCGFPRSLNAINTFKVVTEERKLAGKRDPAGAEPLVVSNAVNKYQLGKKHLEELTGQPESGTKTGYAEFVPTIEVFLKEHLFADIFGRGVLSNQDRELVTVSALTSLGGVEAQLQAHMGISKKVGLNHDQLTHMLDIVSDVAGATEADAGRVVLEKLKSE